MSNAIEFINVSKKFRKGEKTDCLRDFIPSLFRNMFSRNTQYALRNTLYANEFWALKDVSFQLKKGEAIEITGAVEQEYQMKDLNYFKTGGRSCALSHLPDLCKDSNISADVILSHSLPSFSRILCSSFINSGSLIFFILYLLSKQLMQPDKLNE